MLRRRLPWLLALPLMAAGSVAAHLAGATVAPFAAEAHRHGSTLGEVHERTSHGYAGHTVLLWGLLVALAAVVGIRALVTRRRGRDSRGLGAGCFFVLPVIAYSSQELIERLSNAESYPFHAIVEPRFLLGLALQVPFCLGAFLLGWLLLGARERLLRFFARYPVMPLRSRQLRLSAPTALCFPNVRALSRGHPLRGPPLLA